MAVVAVDPLSAGDFTRASGARGKVLAGTFFQQSVVLGAAGGGTATIQQTWVSTEFGFRALLKVVSVAVVATSAVGSCQIEFNALGNRRLANPMTFAYELIVNDGDSVSPEHILPEVVIDREASDLAAANYLSARFETNTDGTTYVLKTFGYVYDLEIAARIGATVP